MKTITTSKSTGTFLWLYATVLTAGLFLLLLYDKIPQRIYHKIYPPADVTVSNTQKIVLFGDSQIANGDWFTLLNRKDIVVEGFPGFTTSHLVWLVSKAIQHHPKVCVMEGGINDLYVGIPITRTVQNYRQILDSLQVAKIQPIVSLTFYTARDSLQNRRVDSLNTALVQLCTARNVQYFSINNSISGNGFLKPAYAKPDGTHIDSAAYKVWAGAIQTELSKMQTATN